FVARAKDVIDPVAAVDVALLVLVMHSQAASSCRPEGRVGDAEAVLEFLQGVQFLRTNNTLFFNNGSHDDTSGIDLPLATRVIVPMCSTRFSAGSREFVRWHSALRVVPPLRELPERPGYEQGTLVLSWSPPTTLNCRLGSAPPIRGSRSPPLSGPERALIFAYFYEFAGEAALADALGGVALRIAMFARILPIAATRAFSRSCADRPNNGCRSLGVKSSE